MARCSPIKMEGTVPAFRDLTGDRFGKWSVLSWSHKAYGQTQFWNCSCDCGVQKVVNGDSLKRGLSTSCGCAGKDWCRTHGMEGTPIYNTWAQMRGRCENANNKQWKNYGARGITVCERWQVFENFYADMGNCPEGMTLDRRDNEKGYEPDNCRWATQTEQIRNRRVTIMFEGEPLAALAEAAGIPIKKAVNRLKAGYTRREDILSLTPLSSWATRRGERNSAS